MDQVEGSFWIPGSERVSSGLLVVDRSTDAEVILDEPILDEPGVKYHPNSRFVSDSRTPAQSVEAYRPVTIHGTGAGFDISLVEARGGAEPKDGAFKRQRYRVSFVVLGAHVSGAEQSYSAMRFQIDDSAWWIHLEDCESIKLDDGSTLSVDREGDALWFVYEPTGPMTIRALADEVVLAVEVVCQLFLGKKIGTTYAQVRRAGGDWIHVSSRHLSQEPAGQVANSLMPARAITLTRLATWITLNRKLDGLAQPVIEPPKGAVQVQLLVLASVAEGLHRRLFDRKRFALSVKSQARIRRAARKAGQDAFELEGITDTELTASILTDALSHLDEISFRERAYELESIASQAVPALYADIPNYSTRLVPFRNEMAHQLIGTNPETQSAKADRLHVIAEATHWTLRVILLRQLGVPDAEIRKAFEDSNRFDFYIANTANIVSDLGWVDAEG